MEAILSSEESEVYTDLHGATSQKTAFFKQNSVLKFSTL
jgi:hypothetical protein